MSATGSRGQATVATSPATSVLVPGQPVGRALEKARCYVNMGRPCQTVYEASAGALLEQGSKDGYFEVLANELDWDAQGFVVRYEKRRAIYNPGVVFHGDQLWLVTRLEGKNTTYQQCPDTSLTRSRRCPHPAFRMISHVLRVPLRADPATGRLVPSGKWECMDYTFNWDQLKAHERELGPEDPRVFEWGGEIHVAINGPPIRSMSSPKTIQNMKTQRLFPIPGAVIDLELVDRTMERKEKNWAPFGPSEAGGYLFSRTVDPHEVVDCGRNGSCTVAASSNATSFFARLKRIHNLKALHLGTNGILLPQKRWHIGIFHGVTDTAARTYLNFVYVFDVAPPYRIIGVADAPLDLPLGSVGSGMVFTTNLAWAGDKIVIGYGVKDRTASFHVTDAKTLLAGVNEV